MERHRDTAQRTPIVAVDGGQFPIRFGLSSMRNSQFLIRFWLPLMRKDSFRIRFLAFPMRNNQFLIRFWVPLIRNGSFLIRVRLSPMRNTSFLIRVWLPQMRNSRFLIWAWLSRVRESRRSGGSRKGQRAGFRRPCGLLAPKKVTQTATSTNAFGELGVYIGPCRFYTDTRTFCSAQVTGSTSPSWVPRFCLFHPNPPRTPAAAESITLTISRTIVISRFLRGDKQNHRVAEHAEVSLKRVRKFLPGREPEVGELV